MEFLAFSEKTAPCDPSLANEPKRLAWYQIKSPSDLPVSASREYSRMKFGDPGAVNLIATKMVQGLLQPHSSFKKLLDSYNSELYLASSAYGSVPNAACAVMNGIADRLRHRGVKVNIVKIHRDDGHELTSDYAQLDATEREDVIRTRRIYLDTHIAKSLENKLLLVMDDLRATGAHERAIQSLLRRHAKVGTTVFGYWVAFHPELSRKEPQQEAKINHSDIRDLTDLLPLICDNKCPVHFNSRMLKFILHSGNNDPAGLKHFINDIGREKSLRFYHDALSKDGYYRRVQLQSGFQTLEQSLLQNRWIDRRKSIRALNESEGKIVCFTVEPDGDKSGFLCAESGESLNGIVKRFSRFKFGDVNEIRWWGRTVAKHVMLELEKDSSRLRRMFESAKRNNEHVYLVAPGIRNVVSASNLLLREVAFRVNIWLCQHELPTVIIKHLTRLTSGRANYATLSATERAGRQKQTKTMVPASDYEQAAIHVLFIDDVEVTGSTLERARASSLHAGAKSFHAILGLRVNPHVSHEWPGIEHALNQYDIDDSRMDESLATLVSHVDYQPVQRLLRLLFSPQNRAHLSAFASRLQVHSLVRIYVAAMSNDYLWINTKEHDYGRSLGLYGPSLKILQTVMTSKGLLDSAGQLID